MKNTAVELLFKEFKELSKASRFSGDDLSANLIDFLCEREEVAKEMENQQIKDAWINGYNSRGNEDIIGGTGNEENEYYDKTYKTKEQ